MMRVLSVQLRGALTRSSNCRRRQAEKAAEKPDLRCRGEDPPGSGVRCKNVPSPGEAYCPGCKAVMPAIGFLQSSGAISGGGGVGRHLSARYPMGTD